MQRGFSLVELSIVMVILGLLTGGILAGQSLIRAAELRSISSDFMRYTAAIGTYRDKYMAIPGDMKNATAFWGVQHATPATCQTTASTTALTCDGDGDGLIGPSLPGTTVYERYRAWQHLASAGLVEGTYSGVGGAGGVGESVIGTNVPPSKIRAAGYTIKTPGTNGGRSGDNHYYDGDYKNIIEFGAFYAGNATFSPAIKPEESWNVDAKLDDGKPAFGKVRAYKSTSTLTPGCTTTDVSATAEYALTSGAILCNLVYITGF